MWRRLRSWVARALAPSSTGAPAGQLTTPGAVTEQIEWSPTDQLYGYAVLRAAAFATWVHRRIETFEFLEAETVRRRMSVDFTIPEEEFSEQPRQIPVPLMILRKADLQSFDIVDADGCILQTLTSRENGEIARRGLEFIFAAGKSGNPEALSAALATVVEDQDPERALISAYRELSEGGYLDAALKELAVGPATERSLRALLKELAAGFMLMVWRDYEPGHRDLVKFSYNARREASPGGHLHLVESKLSKAELQKFRSFFGIRAGSRLSLSGPYRRVMRFLSGFGLVARQEDFEDLQLGWAESYHVELIPPSDMWSADTSLEPRGEAPLRSPDKFRPHLRVGGLSRDSVGQLSVLLHPRPDALVFPLVASAAVIAATMAFIPSRVGSLDHQALAALLVLPSALAAYYVQSSEHRYVTNVLRPLRLLAVVPVLVGLSVLGMLGLGFLDVSKSGFPVDPDAVCVTAFLAKIAATCALLLLVALVSPSVGTLVREKVTRKLERSTEEWPAWARISSASILVAVGLLFYLGGLAIALAELYSLIGS